MPDRRLVEEVAADLGTRPGLIEKDWHVVRAIGVIAQVDTAGMMPAFSGGTSLSKGWELIKRFSEDIDIRIEPFDELQVDTNPNHEKAQHIESRRVFYDKLRDKVKIPGITAVERDRTYDDETLRNAGLRLSYDTHFVQSLASRMEFSWKSASIRRLQTAESLSLLGSSSSPKPGIVDPLNANGANALLFSMKKVAAEIAGSQ